MRRMIMGREIGAIVLDAVGTVIHPEPSVDRAYCEAAAGQGVVLDAALIKARFHVRFQKDREPPCQETSEAIERERWRRIVADVLVEVPDPERAFAELWEHFGRPESWRVYPDVSPALAAFRAAGLPVWIASNFDARLRGVLRGLPELASCANHVVISSECGFRKPDPRFYEAVRAALGLSAGAILFAGDDVENDYEGPRNQGMRSVLIDRDGGAAGDRVAAFSDLLALARGVREVGPSDRFPAAGGCGL